MNKSVRHWAGLSVIGLWLVGAVNTSYAHDACLDARVTASDAGVFESFGKAVAISGDTAIIGAEWDDENGNNSGSAYVFRFDPDGSGTWVQEQKLLASDGQGGVPNGDLFGRAVALDGDVALIGAGHIHEDGEDVWYGAAYVFRYDGSTWLEEQTVRVGQCPSAPPTSPSFSPTGPGRA